MAAGDDHARSVDEWMRRQERLDDEDVAREQRRRDRRERRELRTPHGHGHGRGGPASSRSRLVLALLLGPALLATLIGLFTLWPDTDEMPESVPFLADDVSSLVVTATADGDPDATMVEARLDDGEEITVVVPPDVMRFGVHEGDKLRVFFVPEAEGYGSPYVFHDFAREVPLGLLVIAFVVIVGLVARWRGLAAIVGLAAAFAVITFFTLPALITGEVGLGVALVTSSIVMFIVLYTAHGFTARTSTALLGTLIGLAVTGLLAWWATTGSNLSGLSNEQARWLPVQSPVISLQDVLICGIVLAGMGVLNDVTITQASAVWELRAVAPMATRRELFARAMRIGRDHIASTIYTIAFAYVGAALPLLMIVALQEGDFGVRLVTGEFAEEVVRTLVGSIGLVLAIPITTAIAAAIVPSVHVEESARKVVVSDGEPAEHAARGEQS